jgi:hypothetical protein
MNCSIRLGGRSLVPGGLSVIALLDRWQP